MTVRRALVTSGLLLALLVAPGIRVTRAHAHPGEAHAIEESGAPSREAPRNWHELARAWEFDPGVVIPLLLTGALYVRGVWGGGGLVEYAGDEGGQAGTGRYLGFGEGY